MTNRSAEPIGERVTRVEERLKEQMRMMTQLMEKVDQILDGQVSDRQQRQTMARELGEVKKEIAAMKPHVGTVARSKLWIAITSKIWLFLAGLAAGFAAVWSWVQPYLKLPFGR